MLEGPKCKFVYVVNAESKAEFRPVMVGDWAGEQWVINSGLAAGDRVIVDGVKNAVSQSLQVAEHRVSVLNAKIRVLYLDIPRDERKILGHWLARDPVGDLATLTMLPKGGWYAQGALFHKNAGDGLPGAEADLHKR